MADDFAQARGIDACHNLISAEGALAGSTPDIDSLCVQYQYPRIHPVQFAAKRVKGELVVG